MMTLFLWMAIGINFKFAIYLLTQEKGLYVIFEQCTIFMSKMNLVETLQTNERIA